MGKASRRKRERRAGQQRSALNTPITPKKVYRFFDDPNHADALTEGKVWLSTLETCRAYEDPQQGDPDEATHVYNSGYAVGGSNDEAFKLIASRSGIMIGPGCSNITLNNNTYIEKLPDAYVLCTTEQFNPEKLSETFGKYCVEIEHPTEFFRIVTAALSKVLPIHQAACGPVAYRERKYTGLQNPPGTIGFVKPADKYQDQQEFRFLWLLNTVKKLDPFLLEVTECARFCKRIR